MVDERDSFREVSTAIVEATAFLITSFSANKGRVSKFIAFKKAHSKSFLKVKSITFFTCLSNKHPQFTRLTEIVQRNGLLKISN